MAHMDDNLPGFGSGSPYIDSLLWGCGWARDNDNPTGPIQISVRFGMPGEDPFDAVTGFAQTWTVREMDAFRAAFQLFENVADVEFVEAPNFAQADMVEWVLPQTFFGDSTLGVHEVPDPSETAPPPYGYYNTTDSSWSDLGQGSFGFITIIHELGHALGLAHPHDGGTEDGQLFPGVTRNRPPDEGDFTLNQGIWTTMGYNDGWDDVPPVSDAYGYQATPMAFDIAALQYLYGANMAYNTGDQLYALPTKNGSGTFWSCIWDAGGVDEISGAAEKGNCTIDLNAASLQAGDPHAGGYVSWIDGIIGGFTVANGVVIENATGGDGNDALTGNGVGNILTGNKGDDSLDGGAGDDTMIGGAGNDTYVIDGLGDGITEAVDAGSDTVKTSFTYVLADVNLENLVLIGAAAIDGTGNANGNLLVGNAADNVLDGLDGNDTLKGLDGNDTYVLDVAGDVVEEFAGAGTDTVNSKQSYTLGANLENLVLLATALVANGNTLANQLTGNDENNTLDGKTGVDTMAGGKGDDVYFMDVATDRIIESGDEGKDEVHSAVALKTSFANVEDYVFTGKTAVNFLANGDDNKIVATVAADTLDGGAGDDTLQGGVGNDVYMVDATTDLVSEDAKQGTDLVKSAADFTLGANLENLTLTGTDDIDGAGNELANVIIGNTGANKLSGLVGNDTLTGGDGADTLDGGDGNDIMTGGNGNDVYVVGSVADRVVESLATGGNADKVESSITYVLGANLEDLDLSSAGVANGTGNTLANRIVGSAAANILDGKTGADTLQGGLGNDTYIIDNVGDLADETGGDGIDTLVRPFDTTLSGPFAAFEKITLTGKAVSGIGNAAANTIAGNAAANTLSGLDGSDSLAGAAGNDTLDGGDGDDTLDGGAGMDSLVGGIGDDTYVVDNAKDAVLEGTGDARDLIKASIAIDLGLAPYDNIEDVMLTGAGALKATGDGEGNKLTGNTGANLLIGNDGADTLAGDAGNDTLVGGADADSLSGGAGNDSLDGGAGADSLAGGAGNDTYRIDEAGNSVTEALGEGTDLVRSAVDYALDANVENLVLLVGAGSGTGNGLNNLITGNDAGNILDGQGGVDTLVGGKGSDSYVVDDAKDVVTEVAGADIDTVTSTAASYTLGLYVENLVLAPGGGNIDGTGNTLNNTLTGNAGDNLLDGKAGKDHLIGGDGNDTYVVDTIGDIVDESGGATGLDTVKSAIAFSLADNGTTVLGEIENLTLTGAGAIGGTGNALANHIIGNSGANKLLGDAGSDTLEGGAGADTLDGGADNDRVIGGTGNDRIDVGSGDDTVFYTSKLDGKDVIDNFQGGAGHDVLDLDGLFDTLTTLAGPRTAHVTLVDNGASVDVRVDADGKAANGFELVVATLNTNDALAVGTEVQVGS